MTNFNLNNLSLIICALVLTSLIAGCGGSNELPKESVSKENTKINKLVITETKRIEGLRTATDLFSFCEKYATENDVTNFKTAANKLLKLHPKTKESIIIKEYAEITAIDNSQYYDIKKALERNVIGYYDAEKMCSTYRNYRLMIIAIEKTDDRNKINAAKNLMNLNMANLSHSIQASLMASKYMHEAALLALDKEFGLSSDMFFNNYGDIYGISAPHSKSFSRNKYIKHILDSKNTSDNVKYRIENNTIYELNKYSKTKKRIGYISDNVNITKFFNLWTKALRQKVTIIKNDLYDVNQRYAGRILHAASDVTRKWKELRVYDTNNVSIATIKSYNDFFHTDNTKYKNHIILKGELPLKVGK
jgi:hypothetical protein